MKLIKQKNQDDSDKNISLIEAALYVAGRPLDLRKLASLIGTRSKKKARELAMILVREYAERDRALELVELRDGRFVLQLKPQYTESVRRISMRPILSEGPLKTLSYIAYYQPVTQKKVVEARGSQAYKHIRELKRLRWISTEKYGRTKLIRVTEVLADYLDLSHNPKKMRQQLENMLRASGKERSM